MKSRTVSAVVLCLFGLAACRPTPPLVEGDTNAESKGRETAIVLQAMRTQNLLRLVDGAIDQYCIEICMTGRSDVNVRHLAGFFRHPEIKRMCAEGVILDGRGNPLGITTYDDAFKHGPQLSEKTYESFAPVVSDKFWGICADKGDASRGD